MNRKVSKGSTRHAAVQWLLLSTALLFALVFVAALFCVLFLSMLSLAGVPVGYILLVVTPLTVAVVAAWALARTELRRRRVSH